MFAAHRGLQMTRGRALPFPDRRSSLPGLGALLLVIASACRPAEPPLAVGAGAAGGVSGLPTAATSVAADPESAAALSAANASAAAVSAATVEVTVPPQPLAQLPAGAGFGAAPKSGVAGPLRVSWLLPDNEVAPDHQASLGFDRPVYALGAVEDDAKLPWLKVTPAVPLRLRWIDPQTLAISAVGGWPTAQQLELRVEAGVKALDGSALTAPMTTKFRTPALTLRRFWPSGGPVARNSGFALEFSLPVTAAALRNELVVRGTLDGREVALPAVVVEVPPDAVALKRALDAAAIASEEAPADVAGRVAVVRFREPLPMRLRVAIELRAGLLPSRGDRGLAETQRHELAVHGLFEVAGASCDHGCDPETWAPFQVQFTTAVEGAASGDAQDAHDTLVSHFVADPPIPELRVSCWNEVCHLSGRLRPETRYLLRVKPGLRDRFGQRLAVGKEFVLTTGSLAPLIELRTEGSVYERSEAPWRVGFAARNVSGELRASRVDLPAWLALHYAAAGQHREAAPRLARPTIVRKIELGKPNVAEQVIFDVGKELGVAGPTLAYVELIGQSGGGRRMHSGSLVQITDLHVHVRTFRGGALAFVTSLATGRSVPGVGLRLLTSKSSLLANGTTGDDGTAELFLGTDSSADWASEEAVLVAEKGDDTAILPLDWSTREAGDWQQPEVMRSVLFFEKGLFRPGETAHLRGILRRVDGPTLSLPRAGAAVITLLDPVGEVVHSTKAVLSRHGAFAAEFLLPDRPKYGTWSAKVDYTDGRDTLSDQASFRIAVYEKQRVQADLVIDRMHLLPGQQARATASAQWLSGGPMRDGQVELRVLGSRSAYTPPGWPDFDFGDPDLGDFEGAEAAEEGGEAGATGQSARDDRALAPFEHQGKAVLDAEGRATLEIPAPPVVTASQTLEVEATITDPSGQSLTERATLWLHAADRVCGVRVAQSVIQAGKPLDVDVVVTDLEGKADSSRSVEVRLLSRQYKSIRRETLGGTWEWQTEHVDQEVARCSPPPPTAAPAAAALVSPTPSAPTPTAPSRAAPSPAAPQPPSQARRCSFAPTAAGTYLVEAVVRDATDRSFRSRSFVWVAGAEAVNWGGDDARLELLVADKAMYQPGDTAKILVRNPTPGALALITEDRGRVRRRRVVALDQAASTIDVAIGPDAAPNLYVSAVVYRGRQKRDVPARLDLGAPTLRVGSVNLAVDPSARRLRVAVGGDDGQRRPGEQVEVQAIVLDSHGEPVDAEVTLAVVDEGVLALTGMATPDPFSPLYAHHAHALTDYALISQLVRKRVGEDKGDDGGDGGDSAMIRGDFRDLAYYAPALSTDSAGRVRARFKLPDNLTTYRVMAVAVHGATHFGSGQGQLRVGKPWMMVPRLPRFAQPGDLVEASMTVRHGGGAAEEVEAELEVTVTGDAAKLMGPPVQRVRLASGGATEVRLPLQVQARAQGRVGLVVRLRPLIQQALAPVADAVEDGFDIVDLRPRESSAVFARILDDGPWQQTLQRPADSLDVGGLRLELSSSAVAGLRGDINALLEYPFGCAEQTASKLLALVELRRLQSTYKIWPDVSTAAWQQQVDATLRRLAVLRSGDGYAMWPGGSEAAAPVANAWIAIVLQRARAAGVDIDVAQLGALTASLRRALNATKPPEKLSDDAQVRIVHALARHGELPDVDAGALFLRRSGLTRSSRLELGLALALSTRPLRREQAGTIADEEAGRLIVEAATAHLPPEADPYWGSAIRDEAQLLELLQGVRPQHPLLERLGRGTLQRRAERYATTQDHAASLLGVAAWLEAGERVVANVSAKVQVGARAIGTLRFVGRSAEARLFTVPQVNLPVAEATPVVIERTGQGPVYAALHYDYLVPSLADRARNAGLVVRRTALDMAGTVDPKAVNRGGFLAVTVEVWSSLQRRDVAIVDPLPAGLEAVDFEMAGQPEIVRRKLAGLDGRSAPIAAAAAGDPGSGLDGMEASDDWQFEATHRELTPTAVRFFVDQLPAGRSVFRYVARARTRGDSRWQGSHAHMMYAPEVFGAAASRNIVVR